MAVSTVATMWKAYHLCEPAEEAAQPDTAPPIVITWRRMKRKPTIEGKRRRESVRKIQLEAAPKRM